MLTSFFRKLFLIKEIVSKMGVVHFRRYRLLSTPWFKIYLHNIRQSDEDKFLHDHPWSFVSFIIRGGYREDSAISPHWSDIKTRYTGPGSMVRHHHTDVHKLTLTSPEVWSLVFVSNQTHEWGYQVTGRGWVQHDAYRAMKRAGYFE